MECYFSAFSFQCKCCNIDVDDNQDTLPDLSIVYKIHLECGKMINLYDWLQVVIWILCYALIVLKPKFLLSVCTL